MPTATPGSITFAAANAIQMAGFNLTTANGDLSMIAGAGGIANLGTINLGTGTLTLDSSGTISQNSNDRIQGSGSLIKQGGGTLVMSRPNTYTGATVISDGTLQLGAANVIANASAVTVASGATFDLNNHAETVGSIGGAGNITLGSATLTAGGDATTTDFSGVVSGTGGLKKAGAGVLSLSGANTYTGTTTISGGTLRAVGGAAIGDASQVSLANTAGAVLDLGNDETIGNLSGGGANGGNVTLNGNTLTVNESATKTFAGVISGAGGLSKEGSGTLKLSRSNAYTGTTAINAGALQLSANDVLADATHVVVNGGTLSMASHRDTVAGVQLIAGSITGSSGVLTSTSDFDLQSGTAGTKLAGAVSLNKSTGGTVVLSASNTYTGATNINDGTLRLGAANRIPDASAVTVASGSTLDLNNRSDAVGSIAGAGSITLGTATLTSGGAGTSTEFSGSISGTGALTKTGSGTLTLSGANTYSGRTTVSGGVLHTLGGSAIGDASQVNLANTAGVLLDLGDDETIGNLSGGGANGGNIDLHGNRLTVNEAGTTTFAGIASGSGGLTKQGGGRLTLSKANTYTGLTSINAGTLVLAGGAAIVDTGAVSLNGGELRVSSNETIGRLDAASGTTVTLNRNLTFGDAADTTIAATIGGTRALIKRGTGAVTLSGANTYSGATSVTAGTLVAANAAALGATTSGTTIASGATLQITDAALGAEPVTLNAAGATGIGALVGTGTASLAGVITFASATTIGAASAGDRLTLNAAVNGAQALTQAGSGTVVFANSVGATTPLTLFSNGTNATTRIDGGLLRTSGTQLYDGALVLGADATLQTTNAGIAANGAVDASAGVLTLATGSGAITMPNPANQFGAVAITNAGAVNLLAADGITFDASNAATIRAETSSGDITLDGAITATGGGDSIVLASAANFTNNAGAAALNAGAGRWLVWSTDPALDARGGLTPAFKQYDADYGVTPVAGAGNGLLYSIAPIVTSSLVGTVSKVYDGNTAAVLGASNYVVSGAVDGDVVSVSQPAGGTYDTKHAGTGKDVSVSGLAITGASNGAASVFGYQLASSVQPARLAS